MLQDCLKAGNQYLCLEIIRFQRDSSCLLVLKKNNSTQPQGPNFNAYVPIRAGCHDAFLAENW